MVGKLESVHTDKKAQKRPKKASNSHIRLILGTITVHNTQKQKQEQSTKREGKYSNSCGRGEPDFQSCHITRFNCPVFNK